MSLQMASSPYISRAYLEMQRTLHASKEPYGARGDKWAGAVLQLAAQYQAISILDYGCGQGTLAQTIRALPGIGIRVSEYDPAIPGKDLLPDFADLVNVTDVLEHIEPDRLDAVLRHIRTLARKAVWCVVATKKTHKVLTDGRNAHLIVRPGQWWKQRFRDAGFTISRAPSMVRQLTEKEWVGVLLP